MKRLHNFAAGPATLPEPVLQKVAKEFLSYQGLGYSIIETSHRSKVFAEVLEQTKTNLLKLMRLSGDNYEVLFLHGGATTDFYRIPLNFLPSGTATAPPNYIHTGNWSGKAIKAAKSIGEIHIAGSSEDKNFSYIPGEEQLTLTPKSPYLYLCSNNTLYGTQFQSFPDTKKMGIPLIGDFTSDILSREMDYSQFSLIFASAQKNLGPAGCTIIVIEKKFLETAQTNILDIYSYPKLAEANSLFNTPPVFVIYMINEVLKWMESEGGIPVIEKQNREKANLLYEYLDTSTFYQAIAEKSTRSMMNVTWNLPSPELTTRFIAEAENHDIVQIKGHRLVGGIRASIYNAMKRESIEKLIDFMKKFEKNL